MVSEPPRVPDNARGRVRESTFWNTNRTQGERWRRGWWDAYDDPQRVRVGLAGDEDYQAGRREYLELFAPGSGAGRHPMKIVERLLEELHDHPLNPRERTPGCVNQLMKDIELHGLLQPIVTKPDGTVLLGHRRRWALEELGRKTAPCFVADGENEATALEILMAGNLHIERTDPLREARAVAELLRQPGWTVTSVAETLGRSVKWVARRAQLRNLHPRLEDLVRTGKLFQGWPVEWIEEIAILAGDAQLGILKRLTNGPTYLRPVFRSAEDVERFLADELHLLGKAPFDIHDPELIPKAGPCYSKDVDAASHCMKTTVARPGLFDDAVEGDVKTARCCDAGCWKQKVSAHVAARISAAETEHGKVLIVTESHRGVDPITDALKDRNSISEYQIEKVKAGTRGAVAAVRVAADGSTSVIHVKRYGESGAARTERKATKPAASEKSDAQRLRDSKEQIANRRMAHVVDRVGELVRKDTGPEPKTLAIALEFVAGFEVDAPFKQGVGEHFHGDVKKAKHFAAFAADEAKFTKQLWARLRPAVGISIARHSSHDLKGEYELAKWIAEQLDVDTDELDLQAYDAVRPPRFWPEGSDPETPAIKAARAKRTAAQEAATEDEDLDEGSDAAEAVAEEPSRKRPKRTPSKREDRVRALSKPKRKAGK